MAERTVKVLAFPYGEEIENPFQPGQRMITGRTLYRGDKFDPEQLRPYDRQRAEENGVFYSEEEEPRVGPGGVLVGATSITPVEHAVDEDSADFANVPEGGATGDRQYPDPQNPSPGQGENVEPVVQLPPAEGTSSDDIIIGPDTEQAELAAWIREDRPTIDEVVELADGNPEFAKRLLDAENQATDNTPRKGVLAGLTEIVKQGEQPQS